MTRESRALRAAALLSPVVQGRYPIITGQMLAVKKRITACTDLYEWDMRTAGCSDVPRNSSYYMP